MDEDRHQFAPQEKIEWDQATAEEAFSEARRRISTAKESGAIKLELSDLRTLLTLPADIGKLSALHELHLRDLNVTDLGPLAGLVALRKLTVVRVPVEDLSPLASLKRLEFLWLSQLPASNLAPLTRLSSLETLSLQYGLPVSDLTPIGGLQGLRRLSLEDCIHITDISPLSNLSLLNHLNLAGTNVSSIGAVGELTALQWLDLRHTLVSDLTPITKLNALRELSLAGTRVSDVGPLAPLTALRTLDLAETRVSDLAPISKLNALRDLNLARTRVSDVGPLAPLTGLRTLDLEETRVSDLAALAEFTEMIGQWTVAELYEYDDDYDAPGVHYAGTPVADREPYCRFVELNNKRRTIETINVVRAAKGLQPYYPEGYERLQRSAADEGDDPLKRIREQIQQQYVRPAGRIMKTRAIAKGAWMAIRRSVTNNLQPVTNPELLRLRYEGTDASSRASRQSDQVDCSVFAPDTIRAGAAAVLQVFLHTPPDAGSALSLATQQDDSIEQQITRTLSVNIPRGTRVDVWLDPDGLALPTAEVNQVIVWRGRPASCFFKVAAPFGFFPRNYLPVIRIGLNGVLIGRVMLKVKRTLLAQPTKQRLYGAAQAYKAAFVSYSANDRHEVLKRVQALRAAKISIFQDILSLDPGDRWKKEIYERIGESDLFLLFWSRAAKKSKWVLRETRYAIKCQKRSAANTPDIIPILLEGPPPIRPPRWLRHIHFNDPISYFLAVEPNRPKR